LALTQLGIIDFDKTFMHACRDLRKQIIWRLRSKPIQFTQEKNGRIKAARW